MTTNAVLSNPYVNIDHKQLDIRYGDKKVKLALDKVSKIYLTKKKSKYFNVFPGLKSFLSDDSYNLNIKTLDSQEIRIRIKNFDRQYFIGAISAFKALTKKQHLA